MKHNFFGKELYYQCKNLIDLFSTNNPKQYQLSNNF